MTAVIEFSSYSFSLEDLMSFAEEEATSISTVEKSCISLMNYSLHVASKEIEGTFILFLKEEEHLCQ